MQTTLPSYYRIDKGTTSTSVVASQKRLRPSGMPQDIEPPAAIIHAAPAGLARNEQAALDKCPVEVVELIGSFLESDQDVKNFRATCRHVHHNIEGHNGSFWRDRFLESFDQPHTPMSNVEYKRLYQARKRLFTNGATFRFGHSSQEMVCLEMLRDMAIESYTQYNCGAAIPSKASKNITFLKRFAQSHAILDAIFNPRHKSTPGSRRDNFPRPTEPLLQVIQVMFAPCLLSVEFGDDAYRYPETQQAAFSVTPWLCGAYNLNVDMELVLRQINYWRYHIIRKAEYSLFEAFKDLEEKERPRFWQMQLEKGQKDRIGKRWKGAYAFCDDPEDVLHIRRIGDGLVDAFFNGEESNPEEFQDIQLQLQPEGESTWPTDFEKVLHSLKQPQAKVVTRSQKASIPADERDRWVSQSFRFAGDGVDAKGPVFYDGWLNPLPSQEGVPGWQRMTMMKYQILDDESSIDLESLYAYEGIVLPGGQILVGRWWSTYSEYGKDMYSGPFIMWCVDDEDDGIAEAAKAQEET
ncbi:hypothetical protein DOTSEDRAFT_49736 [Dothistroma septosporum NZE10]|uniref:F-box domain-containing protein n=1 Tax=Dothistroma septosporum (strain NZE10 / CBS 128990) TaxID=675120 RepID=N1Q143_DOTSN|nr:hypothetical protein DOTSEDRAFT_49736 [Dothistroma septosporum NZE10]